MGKDEAGMGGGTLRVAAYVRVSTSRQAGHQISIHEQSSRIAQWCAIHGADLSRTYVEPGASALTDKRPVFRQMIADCLAKPKRYDVILIYNFSRFFRDAHGFESYFRRLEDAGVRIVSATQDVGEGPQAKLLRGILTTFDEFSSATNAETVKGVMQGNARAGYWNGSRPPFGYRTYVAERMLKKDKKKLELDPVEAPIVKLIFNLYLGRVTGDTMGVKAIATYLKDKGILMRNVAPRTGTIYEILKRTTYSGIHYYNRSDSRKRVARPQSEWVSVEVPSIVSVEDFATVQQLLTQRSPRVVAPRTVNSPTLLAGIAKCGYDGCGSGMILESAKRGKYRYLLCDKKKTQARSACGSSLVSMPAVDECVIRALEEKILEPVRLRGLLKALLERSDASAAERRQELKVLKAEKTRINGAIDNLLEALESGEIKANHPVFTNRMAKHNARLELIDQDIRRLEQALQAPTHKITPQALEKFAALLRTKLRDPDPIVRRGYVQMLVDEVVIDDDVVTIRGSKLALEHALTAEGAPKTGVPTFVRGWRARQDSNLRPQA